MQKGRPDHRAPLYGLYLFLSYSHKDVTHARKMKALMEDRGAKVWQDVTDIDVGPRIDDQLRDALHTSHATVVLLSKASLRSPWVMFEMGATWYAQKCLFPVCVDLEPARLPEVLRNRFACKTTEAVRKLMPSLGHLAEKLDDDKHSATLSPEAIATKAVSQARCRKSKRLIAALSESLSPNITSRRHGHETIRNAPELRANFLKAALQLITHNHERIRAEAYYCVGAIPQADGCFVKQQDFFAEALQDDESPFVKACCAQVLRNFLPLSPHTVERLEQCKIFARKADSNDYSELMYRIYKVLDDDKSRK